MTKEFSISNDKVTINFTAKYCDNIESLLSSEGFKRVLECYLKKSKFRNNKNFKELTKAFNTEDIEKLSNLVVRTFKLLTVMTADEVISLHENFKPLLENKDQVISFIEELYSYWRKLERYTVINNNRKKEGIASVSFQEANSEFSKLILRLYRKIEKNVIGHMPKVFRQIPAGGNAGMLINNLIWPIPYEYEKLEDVPFIESISLEAPFITYPKKNTRDGIFKEVFKNPINRASINKDEWYCYPAKVGNLLAYVYFHRDFMAHGITLCNLFELATIEECRGRKPDIVHIFGAEDDSEFKTVFYDDEKNNIMMGYVNYNEAIDYFGYMKKMILTLHNLIAIKKGMLPIHGAMVNISLKDGKTANAIIVGDSGAGKSESLEAFRALGEEYISDMNVIFDDMGFIKKDGNVIKGYGTEIGAFVRLDDLDQGYAFKELDRSIFMNPDKVNARLVMPISSYKDITKGYKVDIILYANNYDEAKDKAIKFFTNKNEAIKVFKKGARMAKGTTTEKGLVESYFANPFGPAQRKEEVDKLLEFYFKEIFDEKILIGEIKTQLAVKGVEKNGPKKAALELLEVICNEI
ncbi:phosphoenolpyruvate carboxykinase [Clostridium fallax]|uniref:Phosphoenolpyruvate carboxykinase (ATP) n=1 Tax=Clostridium fallax TaxID=1533 RepID=A0A1M4V4J3_9CLOT|nr:phosphoenolpyruvate carboxykinase [Clostridium fallax]SHE63812.1 hypothetical protein SAMN05443638_106138 [Clostridium fallax]SQB06555.1 putative P-loop kinase or ATPase distantly related to phosphoenolpyruvate carboxykinase [Clostridium fallax]